MTETKNPNKSLSIRLTPNGLSFCTYTPLDPEPFTYREFDVQPTISMSANVKKALQSEPMLKEDYQRVNVLITNPQCTFVPVADFDADSVESVFRFNFPKAASQRISYNVLRRSGIAIVFGIDRNIYQLILDDFPRARFYASASTLIEFFGGKSMNGTGKSMFAYLYEKEMALYAFDQGRMLWANTFTVNSCEDSMYYILNAFKQLSFDALNDSLYIVGDTNNKHTLQSRLQNFIKDVNTEDRQEEFRSRLTQGSTTIPYDLQTMLVCGF